MATEIGTVDIAAEIKEVPFKDTNAEYNRPITTP